MIQPSLEDTITAIATPTGVGALAIIRISGNKTISVADTIFMGKKRVADSNSHTVHYGKIIDFRNNLLVDDVLLTVFKAPNSYTGEDMIEISCHGNPLVTQKIIDIILSKNIRVAEPGEFTKRAFLNNKIDLAQAEAVVDVITSRSDASLRGARNQLDGLLSKNVVGLRQSLLDTLSLLELELDFVEEDIEFLARDGLVSKIEPIIQKIDDLLKTYVFGRVLRDGVNVAIVGKPNVGKSSLLNYLLKESRAIVSHIPGTTRDIIREEISLGGILFKLYDTAGIRFSEDIIEIEGVRRTNETIVNSDIVLFINDVDRGISDDLYKELCDLGVKDRIIKVINKIDLARGAEIVDAVKISALTGQGIDNLIAVMREKALGDYNYTEKSFVVSNIRHFHCLKSARDSLSDALLSVNKKLSGEFIAIDIRNAVDSLGEIIGEVTSEDILNNIFSKFCIGK